MIGILDIPEVRQRISKLSVADYHQMGEYNESGKRTELIRGVLIEKISKSALHRRLAMRLFKMILNRLPGDFFALIEQPLTFKDSEPEPDVSVIHGNEDHFASSHPTTAALVVEVAVSSPALDRENATLYAEADVEEYWIVLGREQRVEVYRNIVDQRYTEKVVYSRDQSITCASVPMLPVDLGDLFTLPKSEQE